jgi:CDP-diacylglycerol---serine O-phosphatidyltransferase
MSDETPKMPVKKPRKTPVKRRTSTRRKKREQNRISKGIFLLPNLFTTAGLFSGFYAVIAATKGMFSLAAITIFIAMIADGLDGRVARLTNTTSEFGAEYDSLSDMVAFGVAPAVTAYNMALHAFGKAGWLIAFIYAAGGALRLARFNVHIDSPDSDKRFFTGLPIPSAAALVASTIWVEYDNHFLGVWSNLSIAAITIYAGCMMVSNLKFYSFKTFDFKNRVPFIAIVLVILIFVGISIDPPAILFCFFFCYALSAPIYALFTYKRKAKTASVDSE